VRHLYVMKDERRAGIGRSLVERLLGHATSNFDSVRLWTDHAPTCYDSLGFDRADGPKVTHVYSIRRSGSGRFTNVER
jgi:N-acetylglutamate synthase-like GNAT family acetyltransferase